MNNTQLNPNTVDGLYPVVEFDYPDSETNKMLPRCIKVKAFSADWIEGAELDNPLSVKEGLYKKFLRNRISRGQPILVAFCS